MVRRFRFMKGKTFVVVPEGLAKNLEDNKFFISDFYKAALDYVLNNSTAIDHVYLAPANSFGAHQEEDYFGCDYLKENGCLATVILIDSNINRNGYLDTLDNAKFLKKHLLAQRLWPLPPIVLVCNKPHKWRSKLMFSWFGFQVEQIITTRPLKRTKLKMVKRLWFYDYWWAQYPYELAALVFNSIRYIFNLSMK